MFLAIDAGNSNVVFALYEEENQSWTNQFRLETKTPKLISQLSKKVPLYFLEHGIAPSAIAKIGFSSVVPEMNMTIEEFCRNFFGIAVSTVSASSYSNLPVSTLRPNEIGSDLMCNVMAAWTKYQAPVIVVDFGTALTFTVVNENGMVQGVNIVPGLKTALNSLFQNTSKLPAVELKMPESALGQNTVHAIQAGIVYGYTGLVKGMLEAIESETKQKYQIIATGGLSSVLTPLAGVFNEIDRNLTLEGLRLITLANS